MLTNEQKDYLKEFIKDNTDKVNFLKLTYDDKEGNTHYYDSYIHLVHVQEPYQSIVKLAYYSIHHENYLVTNDHFIAFKSRDEALELYSKMVGLADMVYGANK